MKYLFTYVALDNELCTNVEDSICGLAHKIRYAKQLGYKQLHVYEIRNNSVIDRSFHFDKKDQILRIMNDYGFCVGYYRIEEEKTA